jgi:hypothetical protein
MLPPRTAARSPNTRASVSDAALMMVFSDWKRAKNFSHKWRTEKVPIHRDLEILKISVLDIFPIRVPYAN